MRILIAEDDPVSRRVLETILSKWGYEVVLACDGGQAHEILRSEGAPKLAILDWMMPELDGVELCRKLRAKFNQNPIYIILLTAKDCIQDRVIGLDAGANDYVSKPFDREELRARVQVGARMVELQTHLAYQVVQLEQALSKVKQLQGLLPICSYCKKIRDDQNYWQQVESYISRHSEAQFSHSICPDCYQEFVQPELRALEHDGKKA